MPDTFGTWTTTAVPPPVAGSASVALAAVSCPATGSCVAVGTYIDDTDSMQIVALVESSGSWSETEVALPSDATNGSADGSSYPPVVISALDCPDASDCVAVGSYYHGGRQIYAGLLVVDDGGTWTSEQAPLPPDGATDAQLSGLSCPAAGACVATGSYGGADGKEGVLLQQSGGAWSAATAPLPPGAAANQNDNVPAVACADASDCTAVGDYEDANGQEGVILTLASGAWSAIQAPLPSGGSSNHDVTMASVACPAIGFCHADGDFTTGTSQTHAGFLLDQGVTGWTPSLAPAFPSEPSAVDDPGALACPTATTCTALAYGGFVSLASGAWTASAIPVPGDAGASPDTLLTSIDCQSDGTCEAAGRYVDSGGVTQVVLLAGSPAAGSSEAWTPTEGPLPPDGQLADSTAAVSCADDNDCTAVDSYESSLTREGEILTGSSGAWAASTALLPPGAGAPSPVDVTAAACGSDASCVAVGTEQLRTGFAIIDTLADGTWTTAIAPMPPDTESGGGAADFTAVACPAVGSCAAVGDYVTTAGDTEGVVLEQESGTWAATEVTLPPNATSNPYVAFTSISCPAVGSCVAVGSYNDADASQGLVLSQSGSSWTALEAPLPVTSGAAGDPAGLQSVTCTAEGTCEAAGSYTNYSTFGLLLSLSAGTWSPTTAPLPSGASGMVDEELSSVSCPASGSCVAVGSYFYGNNQSEGVIVSGAAGSWTLEVAPSPADASSPADVTLGSVSCPDTSWCSAVGDDHGGTQVIVETLASGTWTAGDLPVPAGYTFGTAVDVTCSDIGDCDAYGQFGASGYDMLLQLSGAAGWTAITGPVPSDAAHGAGAILSSLACPAAATCIASGSYQLSASTDGLLDTELPVAAVKKVATVAAGPLRPAAVKRPRVAITGLHFGPGSVVLFGSAPAVKVIFKSPTRLVAVAPTAPSGTAVDVRVETVAGTSKITVSDRYTYP